MLALQLQRRFVMLAGVDEVGYGALVGDVVAAAVILPEKHGIIGIKDSKKLTANKRESLSAQICEKAIAWNIGVASHLEIDQLNILHASHLAMQRAVAGLLVKPSKVLVDGNKCPEFVCPAEAIIEGDKLIEQISAASIVAKVFRDRSMELLDKQFPGYGFAKHKGYGTAVHIAALNLLGPIKEHRRSYAPVALAASRIGRLALLKV